MKNKYMKWILIAAAVVVVLFLIFYPRGEKQQTTKVTKADIATSFSYSGNLEASKKQDIVSDQEYTIESVNVAQDQGVEDGTTVITMDDGTTFSSSMDGRVAAIGVSPGDTVQMQTVMVSIIDPSSWQVTIMVDENDVTRMSLGEGVSVHVNSLNIDLPGTIKRISPEATQAGNIQVFPVTIGVDDHPGLKAGLSVEVSIPKESAQGALVLPVEAVMYDSDGAAYVVKADGSRADIQEGISDSKNTQIVSGLSEGDEVVIPTKSLEEQMMDMAGSRGGSEQSNG